MTITLSTNANNDIHITPSGGLAVASGLDAVSQACVQAAQAILGEMVFAVDKGVPAFSQVWKGSPNLQQFDLYLRKQILSVADVIEIPSLTVEASAGVLSYTATIRTIYGEVTVNG